MAGSVLYLTTVGNHDSDWTDGTSAINKKSSGGECGGMLLFCNFFSISLHIFGFNIVWLKLYLLKVSALMVPMPYPATRHRPWWSYEIGLVHYIGT